LVRAPNRLHCCHLPGPNLQQHACLLLVQCKSSSYSTTLSPHVYFTIRIVVITPPNAVITTHHPPLPPPSSPSSNSSASSGAPVKLACLSSRWLCATLSRCSPSHLYRTRLHPWNYRPFCVLNTPLPPPPSFRRYQTGRGLLLLGGWLFGIEDASYSHSTIAAGGAVFVSCMP